MWSSMLLTVYFNRVSGGLSAPHSDQRRAVDITVSGIEHEKGPRSGRDWYWLPAMTEGAWCRREESNFPASILAGLPLLIRCRLSRGGNEPPGFRRNATSGHTHAETALTTFMTRYFTLVISAKRRFKSPSEKATEVVTVALTAKLSTKRPAHNAGKCGLTQTQRSDLLRQLACCLPVVWQQLAVRIEVVARHDSRSLIDPVHE
jgi:hypothetical protein